MLGSHARGEMLQKPCQEEDSSGPSTLSSLPTNSKQATERSLYAGVVITLWERRGSLCLETWTQRPIVWRMRLRSLA